MNRVASYSIRQIPRCGKCGKELPEESTHRFVRSLYRLRKHILYWVVLIGFLPALIGFLTFLEYLTSRKLSSQTIRQRAAQRCPRMVFTADIQRRLSWRR
jgi:hypothetical protein